VTILSEGSHNSLTLLLLNCVCGNHQCVMALLYQTTSQKDKFADDKDVFCMVNGWLDFDFEYVSKCISIE